VRTRSGGGMAGIGTVTGTLTIGAGGILAPGDASLGTLTSGAGAMMGGGALQFFVADATGAPGTGWNLWAINGDLTIGATPSNPFTVELVSLDPGTLSYGRAGDFNFLQNYLWEFAQVGGTTWSFNPADFVVNASGFQNQPGGDLYVVDIGNDLFVAYGTPEPCSLTLCGLGLACVAGLASKSRARSRRNPAA
jgi:hypothetical protein